MALFDISASVGIISLREDNEAARLSETDRSCVFRSGKVGVCLERSLCAKEGGVSEAGKLENLCSYCFFLWNTFIRNHTTHTWSHQDTVQARLTISVALVEATRYPQRARRRHQKQSAVELRQNYLHQLTGVTASTQA